MGTDDAEDTDTQGDIHSPRPYPDWVGLVGFGYMQLHVVEPISIKLWLIPITLFAAGAAILWDDFKNP
ncbi:UNVERIFIED_ORG: hypothetical protein GGI57_002828 [Rhizobium aethiopicum]